MAAEPSFSRVDAIVDHWAILAPERCAAIDHDGRTLDWAGLARLTAEASAELRLAGVKPGHRVAILTENCVTAVAFLFACSREGAWAAPINARLSAAEVDAIIDHCSPQAVIFVSDASADARGHATRLGARRPACWTWDAIGVLPSASATPAEPVPADDPDRIVALSSIRREPLERRRA